MSEWKEYHPVVKIMIIGAFLTHLVDGMIVPYFAIYLGKYTNLSIAEIGFIIGASSITAMFGGFLGGTLSDLIGRKVMISSLFLSAFILLGFAFQSFGILLIILTVVKGFTLSLFDPCSKALIGDLTESDKRMKVFSVTYFCRNLGFAIGPIIGIILGLQVTSAAPFYIAFGIFLSYSLILNILLKKYNIQRISGQQENSSIRSSIKAVSKDKVLLLFLIGGLLFTTVYGQFSVTLSQYFYQDFKSGIEFLGILWSAHSLTIIVLSIPFSKFMEKRTPLQSVVIGTLLSSAGIIGFAFSLNLFTFILSMVVFTMGEIFLIPAQYAIIDEITPNHIRGTYYGAVSLTSLGSFFGPWLSGFLLSEFNSYIMFLFLTVISLSSVVFYYWGNRLNVTEKTIKETKISM
ncbi:MFS transporter [Brevibacillus sp. NRS-1366]|uniref:MFS transporter n=1 Tax=Brevibacillus sp. NRS-1366 TaxID=3233899 RepID=UPI003D2153B6